MEILQALEASGFSMWVKESSTAYVAVLAFHTIGLAFLVGISGATAMRVLGVAKAIPLEPMEDFFPLMYLGLYLNAFTGTVLLCLYPTNYVDDPTFYIKITAVVVAVAVLRKLRALLFGRETDLSAADWKQAKTLAATLLLVWLVATVAGRLMAYTAPTKLQTAAAVIVVLGLAMLVGYLAVRKLGWLQHSEQSA